MKKLLIVITFTFAGYAANAQNQDAFRKDVVQYLQMSKSMKAFDDMTKDMYKNVPLAKQADFKKELAVIMASLENKIIDIYMQEFTPEDMKAVLGFYNSPAGQKLVAKTDVLYTKGQSVGTLWGQEVQALMAKYAQ